MRVAWIPPHFEYGDRLFFPPPFLLARRLVHKGVKSVIIAPKCYHEASYEVIDGVEVFRSNDFALPLKSFRYPIPIGLFGKIIKVVRDLDIDIVNWYGYHYLSAAWLPLIKKKLGLPAVMTVIGFPGVNWHYPGKIIDYISRVYAYSLGRVILNFADKIVIVCPHNAGGAKELHAPEEKLEYIPWGIDTELFKPIPERRGEIRSSLGFNEDDFVVGYCGRLTVVKGVGILLQAMQMLLKDNSRLRLLIIGSGGKGLGGDFYQSEARRLLGDKFTMTGWIKQEQVPLYWQAADIAVVPSFAEVRGTAAMEAGACGLPVIASRTGGLQDALKDGSTGFLVTPGDAAELSEKIITLWEAPDLRRKMGAEARRYVTSSFDWDECSERYIELYSSLMERR